MEASYHLEPSFPAICKSLSLLCSFGHALAEAEEGAVASVALAAAAATNLGRGSHSLIKISIKRRRPVTRQQ